MISSVPFPSSTSSSSLLFDTIDLPRTKYMIKPSSSMICCSSSSSSRSVPKLEPFNRNKIDRGIKELLFVQKSENELADYCSTLEGDKAYSCWRAYFELKDLENEFTKDELEMLVIQSGGVKSLIDCVHGITTMQRRRKVRKLLRIQRKRLIKKRNHSLFLMDYQNHRKKLMKKKNPKCLILLLLDYLEVKENFLLGFLLYLIMKLISLNNK
ncbi:hypothetical protein MKW92_011606 [Papaver armeniacum]|nr:hypothetical protein MKW92_011606 [Papaver armeniacum]